MKTKIMSKQEFRDLAKYIKENKSYNVTILEAKVRETGFTDRQRKEFVEILAEALTPIKQDIAELKQDVAEIKALPTIAKELKESKK